ncbi:MAG: FecR domain-containing protein [Tannerellaceae bacterium]|nr:FecR domain-containing protein [Tannerellaceae bacterium]
MNERIIKYFLGELSAEERIDLLEKRETDKETKDDFAVMQNIRAITHLSSDCTERGEGERKYVQIEKNIRRKKIKLTIRKIASYAAVIAMTFVLTRIFMNEPEVAVPDMICAMQELHVPAGQRARITLPDGSAVWLNAGSNLTYPSVFEGERRVTLSGEGFFEVAKDEKKPFIVVAGETEIKALGTQFNVYNYRKADMLSTTLTEGSVKIYTAGKEKAAHILEPNQRLIVKNGIFKLKKSIDKDELLWKEGIYSFKKERMRDIIKKLELYFDVEIEVKNPRIPDYEYTGKFRQRDGVLEILRIIQKIHHFRIKSNEDLSRITLC